MKRTIIIDGAARDFEEITVADTAIGLTAAKAANSKGVYITVETANVRFRLDGTAPLANVGHLLNANESLALMGASKGSAVLTNLKMIRTEAANATAFVTYY